jgi:hypothetical protein
MDLVSAQEQGRAAVEATWGSVSVLVDPDGRMEELGLGYQCRKLLVFPYCDIALDNASSNHLRKRRQLTEVSQW